MKGKNYNLFRSNNNNQRQNQNSNNQNINKYPLNNIKGNQNKKSLKEIEKAKKLREKEIEEQKKENQLEDEIRDHLKCYICLGKVSRPKMCKYCKKICCAACIDQWLENHTFCGICKHQVTTEDMISLPFLDDMSSFFINNIDNQKKKTMINPRTSFQKMGERVISSQGMRNNQNKPQQINYMNSPNINININNIDNTLSNNEDLNEINDTEEAELDENICQEHNEHISFYCIQCDKYYCSKCLVFFGEETKKHKNHFIVQASKINDLGVSNAIKEYQKLGDTKNKLNEIIGLINTTKKEKEIKKYEIITIIDFIREYNQIKMDEERNKYINIINMARNQKQNIDNIYSFLPKELSTCIEQNNFNQTNNIFNKLNMINNNSNINQFLPLINEPSYQTRDMQIQTYQTDYINKKLNISQELNVDCEIINIPINIIQHHPANFSINYSNGKYGIYLGVNPKEDINSPIYPVFNAYIIFKGEGCCLEFLTMRNEYLEKKRRNEDVRNMNRRDQINRVEVDKDKFLYLCDNDFKISFKICVVKLSFK